MLKKLSFITEILDNLSIQYSIVSNIESSQEITWEEACLSTHDVKEKSLFFGLKGDVTNGGKYMMQALQQGASIAMVEQEYKSCINIDAINQNFAVILVHDALLTMNKIAHYIRNTKRESCIFIGVTGSAGKTTSKNILYHILNIHKGAVSSHGNLNTVQGMSLCLLNINWDGVHFAVFECGISATGEMMSLVKILDPDYAVVTNVGSAHMGGYRDINELRYEKLSIAHNISKDGALWIPDNDTPLLEKAKSMNLSCHIYLHGTTSTQDYLNFQNRGRDGITLNFEKGSIYVPLLGRVNVYNALLGYQVCKFFGIDFEVMQHALSCVETDKGRYQLLQESPLVIDDSYNASPEAVVSSMRWFAELSQKHKIAVLGGMKELGKNSQALHQSVLDSITQFDIHTIILYGDEYHACDNTSNTLILATSPKEILTCLYRYTKNVTLEDIAVIFKGSRYYELEKIAQSYLDGCHNIIL